MQPDLLGQIIQHLNWQAQKLAQIEHSVQEILHEMKSLQQQQKPAVDKIEYNFDQLKIEKLEGTLNIGITPEKGNTLADFTVNGQPVGERSHEATVETDYLAVIQSNIYQYLEVELPQEILKLTAAYNIVLDDANKAIVIEDLRKQVDQRIVHYLNDSRSKWQQFVVEKVKADILQGLNDYLIRLRGNNVDLK